MKNEEVHLDPNTQPPIEPEIIEPPKAVGPRSGSTINALAEREDAIVVVERAVQVVNSLRRASIAMTFPHDWTLYKADDNRITGYLEALACWNLRELWGVDTEKVTEPYKMEHEDGTYAWCIDGEGYCNRTNTAISKVMGICYSNEDFLIHRKLHPLKLEMEMKKTARTRMEGILVREAAGLKRVPIEELDDVWKGSWKRTSLCPKGRGFGTADERAGGAPEKHGIDVADIPNCPACEKSGIKVKLVFRPAKGDRSAFLGCPNYAKHPDAKVIVPIDRLKQEIESRKKQQAAREPGEESE